ncbi:MAG: ATP-binding protein [Deltaproteobacteria bacterium]|nr:ATP-binding protein [Deltaproteobacteria bacterium]
MIFKREIAERCQQLTAQYPALILTGARQTGKTTLLTLLFPQHKYVTLDLPSDAELAERDPQLFLSQFGNRSVIIDEAQYAPKLFRHLKIAIDADRKNFGRFILTGSQKFNLMKEVADSLAGRCVWLELEGLSSVELTQGNWTFENLDDICRLMTRGSMPELWDRPDLGAADYYRTYLATYLERDVRQIVNVASLRDFERLIRLLAFRNGQLLNLSELAKDAGVSVNTVKQWVSVLEASNQIALLEPFFGNPSQRVIKSPKVYFSETGLLSFLLGLNKDTVSQSPFVGAMWETLLFSELRKLIKHRRSEGQIWFYRDTRQRELDFLLEVSGVLHFIEGKWTQIVHEREAKNINIVYELFREKLSLPLKLGKRIVLCRTATESRLSDEIELQNLSWLRRNDFAHNK